LRKVGTRLVVYQLPCHRLVLACSRGIDFFQLEINTTHSRKVSYFNYKSRKAVAQASGKNQIS
jgi:hypothetical protein